MGIVSDHMRGLLERQIDEKGIVVWYDPERSYTTFVDSLTLPHVTIARDEGSLLALRHAVDTLMEQPHPPRLLLYVPRSEESTGHALVEFEAVGSVLKPGGAGNKNTRLPVVARLALRGILGNDRAKALGEQVEEGKLGWTDLERLSQQEGGSVVLAAIFGRLAPREIALEFLTSDAYDSAITERRALHDVAQVLADYDLHINADSPSTLREAFQRHVLTTDFIVHLGTAIPTVLQSVPVAQGEAADDVVALAQAWRRDRDQRERYSMVAAQVEATLNIAHLPLTADQLARSHTFLASEQALQSTAEVSLRHSVDDQWLKLARTRLNGFWAESVPAVRQRWDYLITAAELLLEAERIQQHLNQGGMDASTLLGLYTDTNYPWCRLDTLHRRLEYLRHNLDLDQDYPTARALVLRTLEQYQHVAESLATAWSNAFRAAGFTLKGVLSQRHVFDKRVRGALNTGKTAYVLVDALRYEMARDLLEPLRDEFDLQVEPALATIPTITPVGMAALMPQAHEPAALVSVGKGNVTLQIGERVLKDRAARLAWLESYVTGLNISLATAKMEDVIPSAKKAVETRLQSAELLVITSQELDELAEQDNIPMARLAMERMLPELARLIRRLSTQYKCETIILVADHGYLFSHEVEEPDKIDAPGGQTMDLHRRVWIGQGGMSHDATMRIPASAVGIAGGLEIVVPQGLGVFRVQGGARAYFHGGISLPELIVPVATLKSKQTDNARLQAKDTLHWTLETRSKKLSSRYFSVQIGGTHQGLFDPELPPVQLEVRSGGKVLRSLIVAAQYGFNEAAGDIEMRITEGQSQTLEPNVVTLQIPNEEKPEKTVTVRLLDARTGVELARLERIEVALLDY